MAETLRLGGIKLSGELVQIDFTESKFTAATLAGLLQLLNAAELSIPHLHQDTSTKTVQTTLCLVPADFLQVEDQALTLLKKTDSTLRSKAGTLTLFPHGSNVELPLRVLHALAQGNIPLHGISTSVSALVIHTDFELLDRAVEIVLQECELPENHTPLRPVVLLGDQAVETVAVYSEPRIRIYGMDVQRDLCHLMLLCEEDTLVGDSVIELAEEKARFRLMTGQKKEATQICLRFIVESSWEERISAKLKQFCKKSPSASFAVEENVDMVSFHGPHFQDRFGIAEKVFSAIADAKITPISSGCTGTSVHLVVAAGEGDSLISCLGKICTIPS